MSSSSPLTGGQPASIEFPDGLVGLPDMTGFLLSAVPDTLLYELVSRSEPAFAVVLARGDDIRPGMAERLAERGLLGEADALLVMLAVHGEPAAVTANLAGPIIVGADGRARQVVLEDPDLPLRAPVAVG